MMGAAALAMTLGFTGCSSDDNVFNGDAVSQQTIDNYNQTFKKVFGQPAADQTWGFGNAGKTRGYYPNSNMWASEGYTIPADITEAEIQKVYNVFSEKGAQSYESLVEWDCFFVQQVWKGTASYTAHNDDPVVGGNQMDWLCAYDPASKGDDHVGNFNNANGSIQLMTNSSTQRFGFKSSTDNGHVFYNFRMEEIDGSYYVGFDFEAAGQNPNEQVDRDYIYNDWIVKIVPGKPDDMGKIVITTPNIRVMAEDLSVNEQTDYDFNDVVFDVDRNSATQVTVTVYAAGGTLPLRFAENDNYEVHKLFKDKNPSMANSAAGYVSYDSDELKENLEITTQTMINTYALPTHPVIPFTAIDGLTAPTFTLTGNWSADPNEFSQQVRDNIKVEVFKSGAWTELKAEVGEPAAKVGCPQDTNWNDEKVYIGAAFKNYVQNPGWIWFNQQ